MYNSPLHSRVGSKIFLHQRKFESKMFLLHKCALLLQSVKHHLSFLSGTSFKNLNFNSFQKFGMGNISRWLIHPTSCGRLVSQLTTDVRPNIVIWWCMTKVAVFESCERNKRITCQMPIFFSLCDFMLKNISGSTNMFECFKRNCVSLFERQCIRKDQVAINDKDK